MADWDNILNEIHSEEKKSALDIVRQRYIDELSEVMKDRNIIFYYSGFMVNFEHPDIAINDRDLNGFMSVIHGMDKSKGLNLFLHSPGGDVAAAEQLGDYLSSIFSNDILIFIPQLAMSGGTMLSCIGKEIYMGKHSSIGPIDPHFGNLSACEVVQEFEEAKNEIEHNPASIPYWQQLISKYPPAFIGQCEKSLALSSEVAKKWLTKGLMFKDEIDKESKVEIIVNYLNNNESTKLHERHIGIEKARELGLKVKNLEDNQTLQDAVLSVHHCYMYALQNTNAIKIIEGNNGKSFIFRDDDNKDAFR